MTNPFTTGPTGPGTSGASGPSPSGQNPFSGNPFSGTPGSTGPGASPSNGSPFGGSPFGTGTPGTTGGPAASGPAGMPTAPGTPGAPGTPTATPTVVSTSPTTGPSGILWSATAAAVIGLVLGIVAFFSGSATDGIYHTLAIIGWAFAGIVTFIALGLYTGQDTKRRAESFYVADGSQAVRYRVTAGVAVVGVLVTAVEIALWISKTMGA